jgi:hypothetical protein
LPFTSALGTHYGRQITLPELLACYSLPSAGIISIPSSTVLGAYDDALSCCCPFGLAGHLIEHLLDTHLFTFLDAFNQPSEFLTRSFIIQPLLGSPIPTVTNWVTAYDNNPDTTLLYAHFSKPKSTVPFLLASVHSAYRDYICRDCIALVNHRLVVFQSVQNNQELLMLIVVPASLRRSVFSAYHASPAAGHMGVYKTLHHICLQFFWPVNRKDITDWVLQCPHCVAAKGTLCRNSELIFSWPLCCPFYILHVDLWAPGDIANYRNVLAQHDV